MVKAGDAARRIAAEAAEVTDTLLSDWHDSGTPMAEIARATQQSRQRVAFRIKRHKRRAGEQETTT